MLLELKNYQERAINKLKNEVNELLNFDDSKICIFKAPTGSGKTIMMAEFLMRLVDSRSDDRQFSFIWLAVNKLHDQSKSSLKKYYENKGLGLRCSSYEDLEDRRIRSNEILFLNWSSINKKDNIYIRANERDNNLTAVVQRTKELGREIILIIDESHRNAETEISKELIRDINPQVTIEVSATPQLNTANRIVEVELSEVKEEGMVKKEILINPDFESYKLDRSLVDKTADELVIETALRKRKELAQKYIEEGSFVNPLMLIQIPDAQRGLTDKKDATIQLLAEYGITLENGKLAIYLSDKDDKVNLENIEKNTNEVEVMIFKQAIAVGWDCPRAAILVLFREWKSVVFSIQTIGRIMRMPEWHHYANSVLNAGYVYTSLSDIGIAEDVTREYIATYTGNRKQDIYQNIDLISYHSKRFREETRLSADFVPEFFKAAEKQHLNERLSLNHTLVDTKLIASGRIENVDKEVASVEKIGTLNLPKNDVELQSAFDAFVRSNLFPYAPELRSIKRVNDSIYRYFDKVFGMGVDDWTRIQSLVLAEENQQAVVDTINKAKELYQEKVGRDKNEVIQNEHPWNVPETINYTMSYVKKNYGKSIVYPYYARTQGNGAMALFEEDSAVEVAFIDYLEKANKVKWWFRNGKSDSTYFAVIYAENGIKKAFYVDFIVMLNDGRLGLFDTKGGVFAQTAKARAEGLQAYVNEQNALGKKLFGGIVIEKDGSWRLNSKTTYTFNPNDLNEWDYLDLS